MKYLVKLILLTTMIGCSSLNPVYLYDRNSPPSNTVIISSSKNGVDLKKIIIDKFGAAPQLRSATIYQINNSVGSNNGFGYKNVFNSNWDWGYKIYAVSGNLNITVGSNHVRDISKPKSTIRFQAKDGHSYTVYQILRENGLSYNWAPIVFDMTDKEIIYPKSINWLNNL